MMERADLAEGLLSCLRDISALLEQAKLQAELEQKALVSNDPVALINSCRLQEEILQSIIEQDQLAADIASAILDGVDPGTTSAAVVSKLPEPYGTQLAGEVDRIRELARELQDQHAMNKILIQNGMEILACCLRTLAAEPGASSYSSEGVLDDATPVILSLDRKA
ncbi:MAG: flagellar export chaperone FlgN [Armatimonadota bacterium]